MLAVWYRLVHNKKGNLMKKISKKQLRKAIRKSILENNKKYSDELLLEFVPGQVGKGPPGTGGSYQSKEEIIRQSMQVQDGVLRYAPEEYTGKLDLKSETGSIEKYWGDAQQISVEMLRFMFVTGGGWATTAQQALNTLPGAGVFKWIAGWIPGSDAADVIWKEIKTEGTLQVASIDWSVTKKQQKIQNLHGVNNLRVIGTYNGQIVIDYDSFSKFAVALSCALLSPMVTQDNLMDVWKILRFFSGETTEVDEFLGDFYNAWPVWQQIKRRNAGIVAKINSLAPGEDSLIQPASVQSQGGSPVLVYHMDNVYDGVELLKKLFFDYSEVCSQTCELDADAIVEPAYVDTGDWKWTSPWDTAGDNSTDAVKGLKMVCTQNKQTIYGRIQELQSEVDTLITGYATLSSAIPEGIEGYASWQSFRQIVVSATGLKMGLADLLSQADTYKIKANPQGVLKTRNVARFTKPGRAVDESIDKNKNLLLEAAPTPIGVWDWITMIKDSQHAGNLGDIRQFDALNTNDRLEMWIGPDPNVPPAEIETLGSGTLTNISPSEAASWFWSNLGSNEDAVGMKIIKASPTAKCQVILPSPDNFAFYIAYVSRVGGVSPGKEAYLNPFEHEEFVNSLADILTNNKAYGDCDLFIGGTLESDPQLDDPNEQEEEEKEKSKCPDEGIKPVYGGGVAKRIQFVENLINKYSNHYKLGISVTADDEWDGSTSSAWDDVANHALKSVKDGGLGHEGFATLKLSSAQINNIGDDWQNSAKELGLKGYVNSSSEGDLAGMIAFLVDAWNCDPDLTQGNTSIPRGGGKKSTPKAAEIPGAPAEVDADDTGKCKDGSPIPKATWKDIQIQFNQKSKRFSLDQSAIDQLKVDLAKQTAAFIVNPPHKFNPVREEHVGTFTVGIGGRIKNRKSHDWNVPRAYEKIIDQAMKNLIKKAKKGSKGIDNVKNSNIIITIPCGNYTTINESKAIASEKVLKELIRKLIRESK
jgi:hypothetical protein